MLNMPIQDAKAMILTNMPRDVLASKSSERRIHILEGVHIPKEIENDLALGVRYLLHTKFDSDLMTQAWDDFERRIRWRCYFDDRRKEPYDPDYDIGGPSDEEPPMALYHIEQGLRQGKFDLLRQLKPSSNPPEVQKDWAMVQRVRKFLTNNKLLVTISDKNLGVVVMSLSWYHTKCREYFA
jgi:hypothetical protein